MNPLLLSLVLGCDGGDAPPPPLSTQASPTLTVTDEGTLGAQHDEPAARSRKRMRVDQIRDSMEQITGGSAWGKAGDSDWDAYAETLGVPDYQERVSEDRSASVIFQKFLDDAASATCDDWLARAADGIGVGFSGGEDLEDTSDTAVRATLVHLRWQITGRSRMKEDPLLDPLQEMFERVLVRTEDPYAGWNTVCVALFTHPDFFTY